MRLALLALTVALLAACASAGPPSSSPPSSVGAAPLPTATSLPPASSPGESLSRLYGPTPTPILRSRAPATTGAPVAALGYGHVLSAAFVPGAATLAAVTEAGLLLLRLPDLALARFVPLPAGASDLAASPDGKYIAVGGGAVGAETTWLYTPAGDLVEELHGSSPRFSPGGALVATSFFVPGGGFSTTRFFRPGGGGAPVGEIHGVDIAFGPGGAVVAARNTMAIEVNRPEGGAYYVQEGLAAAFSPDGALVAIGGPGGLELLDIVGGAVAPASRRAIGPMSSQFVFTPDGSRLVAQVGDQIHTYSVPDGALLSAMPSPAGAFRSFDPTGELFASGEPGARLVIARVADGAPLYSGETGSEGWAIFSPDGRMAAVLERGGRVSLVDMARGTLAMVTLAGYRAVAYSPDGTLVATTVGNTLHRWPAPPNGIGSAVGFFGDSQADAVRLFAGGQGPIVAYQTHMADGRLWRVTAGEPAEAGGERVLRDEQVPFEPAGPLTRPSWDYSPTAGLLARVTEDHVVMVDDPGGGPPRSLPPVAGLSPEARPSGVAFSPDGARLAVGYNAGALLVVGAGDLRKLALVGLDPARAVTALAWGGGDTFAAGLDDGTIALWDSAGWRGPRLIGAPWVEPVSGLVLSADGGLLGVVSASGAAVLRADGAELLRLQGPVTGLALAPDGRRAAVTQRGRVELWELPR